MIRLAWDVRIEPMSQKKVNLLRNAAGLVVIEPRGDIVEKYKVRTADGVAEFFP